MSVRSCDTCIATTLSGNQCSRTTCKYSPKCWQHSRGQDGLQLRDSNIPNAGTGLFTHEKSFEPGDRITRYRGEKLNQQQLDARYGQNEVATYVFQYQENPPMYIDAHKTFSSLGRYANDRGWNGVTYNSRHNNAVIDIDDDNPELVYLQATKKIGPNEEIFATYGTDYWEDRNADNRQGIKQGKRIDNRNVAVKTGRKALGVKKGRKVYNR